MYLLKTPSLVKSLASHLIWSGPTHTDGKPTVYLTFDDGPHPSITPSVIEILGDFGIPATFFCVGDNVDRYPEVLTELKKAGHGIGNHTQRHDSGWNSANISYLRSYLECQERVQSPWFRPPYGRITPSQAQALRYHTQIIMWDVLSADFDEDITPEFCLNRLFTNTRPGAIVVFHDSPRASFRMLSVLRPYCEWLKKNGYSCALLPKG